SVPLVIVRLFPYTTLFRSSAFSERASFATCSAVSTGTCRRAPENMPTIIGPRALRIVCPTRPEARPDPVTTYARLRRSRPSWEASEQHTSELQSADQLVCG